jgi:hypothetical protein
MLATCFPPETLFSSSSESCVSVVLASLLAALLAASSKVAGASVGFLVMRNPQRWGQTVSLLVGQFCWVYVHSICP